MANLPPGVKQWGPPKRQGSCSKSAHLWAIAVFVPSSAALETPQTVRVM